jgi:NhaP-type Na+/H+ or K+/H+ antiporter
MKTVYDWVTLGIFAGLVVLFLQRSTSSSDNHDDPLIFYLAAGVLCGFANYLGNSGQDLLAVVLIVGALGLILHFLKPFRSTPKH